MASAAKKMKHEPEMVTQSEFVRRRGCSRQHISQLIKRGQIELVGKLIDHEKASAILDKATSPAKKKPSLPKVASHERVLDFQEARTKREQWDAKNRELDYMKKAGQLVDVAEVKRAQYAHDRMIRSRIEAIAGRVSPRLAGMKSERKIREYLAGEFRLILEEMADASRTC